ncbi:MAG: abortive infection family protein, partial [Peptococcaceae bacterium]|nr:abortive infection family protein [Peptococcaceae bacterium]
QMRNASSDSHGVGGRRIKINEHHARLFVNSALTMADFLLSVEKNANNSDE